MKITKLVIAVAVSLAATAAHSETFNYSYRFASGGVITGSFDGTASGNLVTNLSNIFASVNGVAFNGSGALLGSGYNGTYWIVGAAVASFDGLQNNFGFSDGNFYRTYTNWFISCTDDFGDRVTEAYAKFPRFSDGEITSQAMYTLVRASTVPEPETYALMVAGIGMIGTMARRQKAMPG